MSESLLEVSGLTKLPPGCAFAPRCGYRVAQCDAQSPTLVDAGAGAHVSACWELERLVAKVAA